MPFDAEEFLNVFAAYNNAVYPAQILLGSLGLLAVYAAVIAKNGFRIVAASLSGLWIWSGVVYHIGFFTAVNPLAYLFGALFILEGGIILYFAWWKQRVRFHFVMDLYGVAGVLIITYSILFYPLAGYLAGHSYPRMATFGVPCPTTIFTYGLLLSADNRLPFYVLAIPSLWALVGISAVVSLGMVEDMGLPITALISTALLFHKFRRREPRDLQTAVDGSVH